MGLIRSRRFVHLESSEWFFDILGKIEVITFVGLECDLSYFSVEYFFERGHVQIWNKNLIYFYSIFNMTSPFAK